MRTSAKPNKLYNHSKAIDESYPNMYFLLNLSHYVKSYGHLCQFLAFLTMPALQIWPFHVTQEANFSKILFFPNSAFNIRKNYKIYSRKALYFRSYQPKSSWGVENTPPQVLLGLRTKLRTFHLDFVICILYLRNGSRLIS